MRVRYLLVCLVFLVVLAGGCLSPQSGGADCSKDHVATQTPHSIEKKIVKIEKINYLLFLPEGYGMTEKKWPVILFLHGGDRTGDDLEVVKGCALPRLVEDKKDFPFVLISPQMPAGDSFLSHVEGVMAVLDEVLAEHKNADPERVYLTGLSMGGAGTWYIGSKHPGRFAAMSPICGGGNYRNAPKLKDVPIWAFHGAKDKLIPVSRSKGMVEAINKCGGNAKLSVYPDMGHVVWGKAYQNPKFYDWLLEHRKEQN